MLRKELPKYKVVFTHDWIFTGWNLPYFLGMKNVSHEFPNVKFLHWIHSLPGGSGKDWWRIREMGPNHKIIFPCEANRTLVAEKYHGWGDDVRIIPHIKDPMTYFDFSEDTREFLKKNPQIWEADILQLLPASVDRLDAKRVGEVIEIFSYFKELGHKVCLIVAAQWATTQRQKQDIQKYKDQAKQMNLTDKEVLWTPDIKPEFEVGIPHRMIRELFQLSNLFIFPTREESFGLVVPEAGLSGNFLVLNRSLYNQLEITGHNALYFEFGSFEVNFTKPYPLYNQDLAKIILGRLKENELFKTKTLCRQRYNAHSLYTKHYAPVMNALMHNK
jgi:glycosyltransferase involved in cell wall biosynthesis